MTLNDLLTIIAIVGALLLLFHPKLMHWRIWRATVTPLASIIGSGFLVLGPILKHDFGSWAILIMLGLCLVAYLIGGAIRFNIACYDEFGNRELHPLLAKTEMLAGWALALAYVISVTYYLNLFGAFAVRLTPAASGEAGKLVASGAVVFIGIYGFLRGLTALENMEEVSVGIKLSIIVGLLTALTVFAVEQVPQQGLQYQPPQITGFHAIATMFGLVITVQGFETSRYLVSDYDARTCIFTMKIAQWISTGIYLVFIGLIVLAFDFEQVAISETAIIDMTRVVAPMLPSLLVVAALASQFSAAVADTSGGGGLTQELSRGLVSSRQSYAIIAVLVLVLTWSTDIFQIIALASRAFAVYYFFQALIAVQFSLRKPGRGKPLRVAYFSLIAALCLAIVLFGVSVEGNTNSPP